MIAGTHAIFFCEDPDKARDFFRDVLRLDGVDAGAGWLVFKLPPAELAMHPEPGDHGRHEVYFMCQDLPKTIDELKARGVEFVGQISEQRWGSIARFKVPGAGVVGLYQPAHPSPLKEFS